MKTQLTNRLQVLKTEFDSGQKMLNELVSKESEVRQSMLRISGAIQVLEEELEAFEKSVAETVPETGLEVEESEFVSLKN